MTRPTFTAWFVQALACAGAAFFAWTQGVFQTIYASDASMMTSVIACLLVATVAWAGRQAWSVDSYAYSHTFMTVPPSTEFGHLAERLSVMAGFVGTAIGLSLQAKALAGGSTSFTALATALFTTASGGTAAAVVAVMTFSLDAAVRRARK